MKWESQLIEAIFWCMHQDAVIIFQVDFHKTIIESAGELKGLTSFKVWQKM